MSFQLDVKRFYFPCKLEWTCACGAEQTEDFAHNYLSYPTANEPFDHTVFCGECESETVKQLLLTVKAEWVGSADLEDSDPVMTALRRAKDEHGNVVSEATVQASINHPEVKAAIANAKPITTDEIRQRINGLDPGIRETVEWLRRRGFETTDSGDGSKGTTMECALDYPNVFMRVEASALCYEADRLRHELGLIGIVALSISEDSWSPSIQATYDPTNDVGVLALLGVDDRLLNKAIAESGKTHSFDSNTFFTPSGKAPPGWPEGETK